MRVVVDTNVMISALLWQGPPHEILKRVEQSQVTLCMTQPMLLELQDVLGRAKFLAALRFRHTTPAEILASLAPLVELYEPTPVHGAVPQDPDDEIFVECAQSAGAEFMISGDSHLLKLKHYERTNILTPREFLDELDRRLKVGN